MTDLERFFCRLVETLSAIDPAHLRQPVPIAEIRGSIMPYRSNRRALHLDTSEDYELVLMRLCAGEGGFAAISPDEARARFKIEVASSNPDLNVLRQFGDATLILAPGWVAAAMAAAGEDDAERQIPDAPAPAFSDAPAAVPDAEPTAGPKPANHAAASAVRCDGCGETLPGNGAAKFCPYCGKRQLPARCAACSTPLEAAWRFCPACGRAA